MHHIGKIPKFSQQTTMRKVCIQPCNCQFLPLKYQYLKIITFLFPFFPGKEVEWFSRQLISIADSLMLGFCSKQKLTSKRRAEMSIFLFPTNFFAKIFYQPIATNAAASSSKNECKKIDSPFSKALIISTLLLLLAVRISSVTDSHQEIKGRPLIHYWDFTFTGSLQSLRKRKRTYDDLILNANEK